MKMNDLRRRKLSTFRIEKTDPKSLSPVQTFLLRSSPVYKRKALDIGLSPRLVRHAADLRALDWQRFEWKVPQAKISPKVKCTQTSSKHGLDRGQITLTRPNNVLKDAEIEKDKEQKDVSKISRSLPLVPINRLGQPMLRRPTVHATRAVHEDEGLFEILLKGNKLKPFSFKGNSLRAIEFYASHYPLLLQKLINRSLPGSAKPLTEIDAIEQLRVSSPERRCQEVHERINRSDDCLVGFEHEDDDPLVTELRSDLFDPRTWPWNVEKYKLPSIN